MMEARTFRDRHEAGAQLAEVLHTHLHVSDPLVLAIARGGVPIGVEIARALGGELDVIVIGKLCHPLQPEVCLGAVTSGGVRVLETGAAVVAPAALDEITQRTQRDVARRSALYRAASAGIDPAGRNVVLVDDGLASGISMRTAIRALRMARAHRVIVAVPVGNPGVCARLSRDADRVLCPVQPTSMAAVNEWYERYPRLTDADVIAALLQARQRAAGVLPVSGRAD